MLARRGFVRRQRDESSIAARLPLIPPWDDDLEQNGAPAPPQWRRALPSASLGQLARRRTVHETVAHPRRTRPTLFLGPARPDQTAQESLAGRSRPICVRSPSRARCRERGGGARDPKRRGRVVGRAAPQRPLNPKRLQARKESGNRECRSAVRAIRRERPTFFAETLASPICPIRHNLAHSAIVLCCDKLSRWRRAHKCIAGAEVSALKVVAALGHRGLRQWRRQVQFRSPRRAPPPPLTQSATSRQHNVQVGTPDLVYRVLPDWLLAEGGQAAPEQCPIPLWPQRAPVTGRRGALPPSPS